MDALLREVADGRMVGSKAARRYRPRGNLKRKEINIGYRWNWPRMSSSRAMRNADQRMRHWRGSDEDARSEVMLTCQSCVCPCIELLIDANTTISFRLLSSLKYPMLRVSMPSTALVTKGFYPPASASDGNGPLPLVPRVQHIHQPPVTLLQLQTRSKPYSVTRGRKLLTSVDGHEEKQRKNVHRSRRS